MGERYQGWTNFETWGVRLWLISDASLHGYWRERATELGDVYALADEMKDAIEAEAPELEGMYSGLLTAAMGRVNWEEIAGDFMEE